MLLVYCTQIFKKIIVSNVVKLFNVYTDVKGAEEDCLHEMTLMAMKVANDPHLLPYPL